MGCVCVDMQKMELHYWWEHGDKKKMINQLNGKHSLVPISKINFCSRVLQLS